MEVGEERERKRVPFVCAVVRRKTSARTARKKMSEFRGLGANATPVGGGGASSSGGGGGAGGGGRMRASRPVAVLLFPPLSLSLYASFSILSYVDRQRDMHVMLQCFCMLIHET